MHSKKIEFEKLKNVRDLCTMVNKDGFHIKENKLFRSTRLYEASQNDLKKLYEECNVRNLIDFRTNIEKYEKPEPIYLDTKYKSILVQEESYYGVTYDEESVKKMKEYFEKLDEQLKDSEAKLKHMCEFYYSLACEYSCKQYGMFLNEVIECKDAILWHCSLGRDRCGVGTALLLTCLDVDRENIIEDYVYTDECLKGEDYYDGIDRRYLESYFKGVEDAYGSVINMLDSVGIDENKRNILKEKYLEK